MTPSNLIVTFLVSLSTATALLAQDQQPQHRLTMPGASPGTGAATAVSTNGRLVASGAYRWNGAGGAQNGAPGAFWIHQRNGATWSPVFAQAGMPGDELGTAVSLSPDNLPSLAVGAPGHASLRGAVHLFDERWFYDPFRARFYRYWQRGPTLFGAVPGGRFGHAVANAGSLLAVGAPGDNGGAVYVYRRSGSQAVFEAKLTPHSSHPFSSAFGYAVAIDGDALAVGGQHQRAYVFRRSSRNGWVQEAELFDYVGGLAWSIAIHGDTVVTGGYIATTPGKAAAIVFRCDHYGVWRKEARLSGSVSADNFNVYKSRVALDGDTAIIGAEGGGGIPQRALIFRRSGSTWTLVNGVASPLPQWFEDFGSAVALDGSTLVLGAAGDSFASGAAYVHAVNAR